MNCASPCSINSVGRAAADTGWQPLRVRLAIKPAIAAVSRAKATRKGSRIRIRGKNFVKQTTVVLRGPDGVEHEFRANLVDDDEIAVRVRESLPRGRYDVIVKNPGVEPVIRKAAFAYRGPPAGGGTSKPDAPRADRAMARSVVLPGWGQFAKGDYFKTVLTAGGFLLPLAFVDSARHDYLAARDDIRATDFNVLLLSQDSNIGIEAYLVNALIAGSNEANLRNAANRFRAASLLALGFYAYNIWDAYFASPDDEPVGPGGALWRSAILPGWGQAARGDQLQGAAMLGAVMISAAWLSNIREDFTRASRERDMGLLLATIIPTGTETQAASLWALNLFQDSETALSKGARSYQRLSIAMAGIYLYNLYDAWRFYRAGGKSTPAALGLGLGIGPSPDGRGTQAVVRYNFRF